MEMCVKEIPTLVHLYFVQLTNECQCRTARARSLSPRPESIDVPINNSGFEFSTDFLHLFRQSSAEIPLCQVKRYRSTSTTTFGLGIFRENCAHIHQSHFSVG